MIPVLKSLEDIATGFSVFEKDQVLTHDQLNSVVDYFDDQTRLSRVTLLGAGIVCGLRVSVRNDTVQISRGVGVTTDGDLLYLNGPTAFDRFKRYDESNPVYPPFYSGGALIPLYELVREGVTDARAAPLSQFNAQTGAALGDMAAVMLMESYVRDNDLCSGTDCDNLGKDRVNTPKLLLVDKTRVGVLTKAIATPHQAHGVLSGIVVERPVISAAIGSFGQLAQLYRAACNAVHARLNAELAKLYPKCAAFLSDVFASDPAPGWTARLTALNAAFAAADSGIQYYYGFLKDLAETYHQFHELLLGDTTGCWLDTDSFPKHLLLGNVIAGADPDENRTLFYPSPVASRTAEQLEQAKFLAGKLDTLIQTFQVPPSAGAAVRITPSLFEDRPLDERAIPYYYAVNATHPIHQRWNYPLHRRGMDAFNYSYHAAAYGAQGGAANPLRSQLGRFPFFRIEGHQGQAVSTVLAGLESQIAGNNLPFTVRSVMVGTDKAKVVKKPGIRYTDLHRFHYVLRQDLFHQLDEVAQFSGTFKRRVDTQVADDDGGPIIKDIAAQKDATVAGKTAAARAKLNRGYSQYTADLSWKSDLNDAVKAAGEFKYDLSPVVKTEFNTPFDSLIGTTHFQWLDWLDILIKDKEDKEDDQLLLSHFIAKHPSLEHFAGVSRGGTFVLVYDSDNIVVADFMLPYYCPETAEPEAEQPALPKPGLKPGWIVDNGIKITPSLDRYVKGKLNTFQNELEPRWQEKFNLQKDYFTVFKDSFTLMSDVFQRDYFTVFKDSVSLASDVIGGKAVRTEEVFTDELLGIRVKETRMRKQKAELLKRKAGQTDLPEETRRLYRDQAREAEAELAKSIQETVDYVSVSGMAVATESEGFRAVLEASDSLKAITDAQTLTAVNNNLAGIRDRTGNDNLKIVLGTVLRR